MNVHLLMFVLAGVFILKLLIGVPVAFALGIASTASLAIATDIRLVTIVQRTFSGIDNFSLLAIPCFILVGKFMSAGGIAKKIIDFANALVGRFFGGLALVNIVASLIFAGKSGSAVADTSAIGGVLIPSMVEEGYDPDFSVAVTASSSGLAPLIPPSISFVLFGVLTGVSISQLFIAGIVPGFLYFGAIMVVAYYYSRKKGYGKEPPAPFSKILSTFKDAFLAMLTPVIILLGIVTGIFTVTEAAAIAAIYAGFLGLIVYRQFSITDLPRLLKESALTASSIMIVIAMANIYSWVLVRGRIPNVIADYLLQLMDYPILVILLMNVFLLIIGMFIEPNASQIITVPLLYPIAMEMGIAPLQFGVIVVFNLCLALLTPPVGLTLLLSAKIGERPLEKVVGPTIPFFIVGVIVLLLLVFVPQFSTFLPGLLF